jgi:DNA (cytosine-5)-methyltransferase 1
MNLASKISLEEQQSLIKSSIENKENLSELIKKQGLCFDDFRYNLTPDLPIPNTPLERLDEKTRVENNIPAISFFAGAGGFDIGFHCAGYENLASVEINELFCNTLRHNFPKKLVVGPPFFTGDVRNRAIIGDVLRNKLGLKRPFEGVFHGGPPCQPFSVASNQRFSKTGDNFKRVGFEHSEYGNLLFDYLWFIDEFRPKVFIIENVAGFMDMDNGEQVRNAVEILEKMGYTMSKPQIFDLADFGVPQHRNRFILVGSRTGQKFKFPTKQRHQVPCIRAFEKNLTNIANHETRDHKPDSLLRYIRLEFGKRDKLGRVDRLNPAKPSKTVIAGGMKGGGRSHLHPFIPRTISVRECARIQTFPDWYVFTGAIARQFTQVGNAVPPLFAYKLAIEIYEQFFSKNQEKRMPVVEIEEQLVFEEFV